MLLCCLISMDKSDNYLASKFLYILKIVRTCPDILADQFHFSFVFIPLISS